ncbi:hypothetical protein VNO77_25491 [Canavalia gladiata]|uniref:Uncharacterized protein n=1 Tax=Canavalia gladiata TaxID=3824 RepID=A0AAN9L9J7_CANGL
MHQTKKLRIDSVPQPTGWGLGHDDMANLWLAASRVESLPMDSYNGFGKWNCKLPIGFLPTSYDRARFGLLSSADLLALCIWFGQRLLSI